MSQQEVAAHSHGAPIQTRSERPKSTTVSDFPEISKTQEIWRYIPQDKLRGLDSEVMSEIRQDDVELTLSDRLMSNWIDSSDPLVGSAGLPEDRISAAAWTNASKSLLIEVPANTEIAEPQFVKILPSSKEATAAHILIHVKNHSKLTMVLDHVGTGVLAENVEIMLEDGSELNFVSLQEWESGSTHISTQFARLGRSSKLKHIVVNIGGDLVRVVPAVKLDSPGAEVNMYGVYLADSGNYFEHRPYVDHIAENCVSNVAYKGALQGAGAHTVWVGDVLIRESAVGTDTYELNRNLLLVDGARADSVPNLEIETGKISGAGHASASGRFDDLQLFYLMARGIDEVSAKKLVVRGFLNEIIQKIEIDEVEQRLISGIEAELEKVGS
ncbi:MAG: Fe-S cluster assembly protein SufD [Actinomycetota bacterium]